MPISSSRKASATFLVFVLLGGILAAFAPAMLASREIRRFCDGLPLGTSIAEVQSRASAQGYAFVPVVSGQVLVEHPHSMGRAYCKLAVDPSGHLSGKQADN